MARNAHAQTDTAPPASTAALAGTVRDSLGHGLAAVEVMVPGRAWSTRTDSTGRFLLGGVQSGVYEVWFRRIGFASTQFDWQARAGERVEIDVHLRLLPQTLDPMIVRAQEDRSLAAKSSVAGFVLDSVGAPVPNAEVQLLGAGRTTTTGADGSFVFRHVRPGDLTVRARRMGFAPGVVRLQLVDNDQREVTMRLGRLLQTLDAVQVSERSGFGADERAWQELDQRQHFRSVDFSVYLGPEQLRQYGATPLDVVAATSAIHGAGELNRLRSGQVTIIRAGNADYSNAAPTIEGDACILENGQHARRAPLDSYAASDVAAVEYYPPGPPESDPTHTIYARFLAWPACAPPNPAAHPAYWVIWLNGAR